MAAESEDPGDTTRIFIRQTDARPAPDAYDAYDIFVSNALADSDRRVAALANALQHRCEEIMGREVRVGLGDRLVRPDARPLREEVPLPRVSRTMLILSSPAWLRSEACREELDAYLAAAAHPAVFVAEIMPLDEGDAYPEILADRTPFRFWHRNSKDEIVRLDPQHDDFKWQITKLADAVAIELIGARERPAEPEPPAPPPVDRYRTLTDDPARIDALERGPFAAVIAARIAEVRAGYGSRGEGRQHAFMVHLHGPWGSGKSSMLSLVQQELEKHGQPSLVVWFNAWKHQRRRPPWWALLTTVYEASVARCYELGEETERNNQRWALRLLWWRWRLRAEWVPILLIAALLGGLMFALLHGISLGTLETPLKIVGALITAGAGVYTYARLIVFGSGKAAQTYAEQATDPYEPVVRLFHRLVETIRPPLVVFIDDLDRCDSDYVVELLEGIQTLFRDAHVTYVVAADRKWICSSFEKKYGDFAAAIGDPGRPLGHLFLEKMFQISVGMPRLTPEIQARYLAGLLAEGEAAATAPDAAAVEAAAARVSGITDEAAIQRVIAETKDAGVAEQRAVRAAAALQITSAEAARATEHRLQKFARLLEPNPRSMKRLVNAVGMAQARGILEGRTASPETRARWTMLSLRWPVLAEFIADNPEAVRHWTPGAPPADEKELDWPAPIKDLLGNRAVMAVVGEPGGDGSLTPENLAPLLG